MSHDEHSEPRDPAASASMADTVTAIGLALLANVPLALRGAPGTGKTSLLRSIAGTLRWPIYTISTTIHDPTDFSGLPYLSQNGSLETRTMRAPLQWAITLGEQAAKNDGHGLLFFDDIAYAPPAVQNALLQIIQERRVGDYQLPPGVRCTAALNPGDTAASMRPLTAPLANRMVHLTWAPDALSWSDGYLAGWRHALPTLPQTWVRGFPEMQAKLAAFVRSHPQLLHREPADELAQSRPWPSARTWEMLGRLMSACDASCAGDSVRWMLAAGCVGEEAAAEYMKWERQQAVIRGNGRLSQAAHAGSVSLKDR
jgi:hypothetical protein